MTDKQSAFLLNSGATELILKITCIFWLAVKLLSRKIWTSGRRLPMAPIFDRLSHVPPIVHVVLFILSLCLITLSILKTNRLLLAGLLLTEAMLCALDLNRLMPWEYLYAFIIFIFLINAGKSPAIILAIAFIFASTYFYGGLCKLNEGFLNLVWGKMILRGFLKVPKSTAKLAWVSSSGYLLGFTEVLAGIGLLFPKSRIYSAIVLITMHVFILALFSPLGYRGYRVLWPWNISMILCLYFIFIDKGNLDVGYRPLIVGWNKLVVVVWGLLPAFSFIGYWDRDLSSNLFSANVPSMVICVSDTSKCRELRPFFFSKDIAGTCHGQVKIDIQAWAHSETGQAAYPEWRTYKIMQKELEQEYTAAGLTFVYLNK